MTLRQRFRRWRKRAGPHVPKASLILALEILGAIIVLAVAFTGKRGVFLDRLHPRADALVVAVVAVLVAILHFFVVTRILPELRRRASPAQPRARSGASARRRCHLPRSNAIHLAAA